MKVCLPNTSILSSVLKYYLDRTGIKHSCGQLLERVQVLNRNRVAFRTGAFCLASYRNPHAFILRNNGYQLARLDQRHFFKLIASERGIRFERDAGLFADHILDPPQITPPYRRHVLFPQSKITGGNDAAIIDLPNRHYHFCKRLNLDSRRKIADNPISLPDDNADTGIAPSFPLLGSNHFVIQRTSGKRGSAADGKSFDADLAAKVGCPLLNISQDRPTDLGVPP